MSKDKSLTISVCMATYNGARFVDEQIQSIIRQLLLTDELLIYDDCSSDGTLDLIMKYAAPNVRIYSGKNLGCIKNFERLILMQKKNIVVLADQDDIWSECKLDKIRILFANEDVQLIYHSARSIDGSGRLINNDFISLNDGRQNRFLYYFRQLSMPSIYGCALAFRSQSLKLILPFPRLVYAHDHWIAIACGLLGNIYFSNLKLIDHRLHSSNLTPSGRRAVLKIFISRITLLFLFFIAFYRFILIKFSKEKKCLY